LSELLRPEQVVMRERELRLEQEGLRIRQSLAIPGGQVRPAFELLDAIVEHPKLALELNLPGAGFPRLERRRLATGGWRSGFSRHGLSRSRPLIGGGPWP
jgi:hypothetical protein